MAKDSDRRVTYLLINCLIYGISGVLMFAVGLRQVIDEPFYSSLVGTHVHEVSVYYVLIGIHATVCSTVALLIVHKKKEQSPKVIVPCLIILFCVFAFAGGIGAYVYQKTLPEMVGDSLNASLKAYTTSSQTVTEWDVMHTELECCGIQGPSTWQPILGETVPDTCCITFSYGCGRDQAHSQLTLKGQGCYYATVKIIQHQTSVLSYMGVAIAFIEVTLLMLSYWHAGNI